MKNFTEYLIESSKELNPVVFAFGRMNPPTTGHAKLVDKVHELAQKHNAHHEIVLSHTEDPKKNPLSAKKKLKHARRFFPNTNISVSSKEKPNFIAHAKRLSDAGHKHLIMVAGSDRAKEYQDTLNKYNGKEFHFKKITVVSAGHRDPDAEGTEGMSASKMRGHATSGNFKEFRKGVPGHVSDAHAKELYHDVRNGSQIKEHFHIGEILESEKGVGKIVSIREDAIVCNMLETGAMRVFTIDEAIGNIGTAAPPYFWGGVADYRNQKEGYKEVPGNDMRFAEEKSKWPGRSRQDPDLKDAKSTTPARYYAGLEKGTKEKRLAHFRKQNEKSWKDPSAYTPAPGDKTAKTKPSKHTLRYRRMFGEGTYLGTGTSEYYGVSDSPQINKKDSQNFYLDKNMNEEAEKGLAAKAEKSGVPLSILRKVYNRGMAAWRGGHRPGTTPQQWAMARVNSYITKGKGTYYGADADLRKEELEESHKIFKTKGPGLTGAKEVSNIPKSAVKVKGKPYHFDDESGHYYHVVGKKVEEDMTYGGEVTSNLPYYSGQSYDRDDHQNIRESHLFGTDAAKKAYQEMTPGEPGYKGKDAKPSVGFDSREGETAANLSDKKKKLENEDYMGADYNSRLSGAARSSGGLGGSWSIPVQESELPADQEIVEWAKNPSTQRMFVERYGDFAGNRLVEAAQKMAEAKTKNTKSFTKFRKEDMGMTIASGSDGKEGPPVTGYAKQRISEEMQYHIENQIPVCETIYRVGSKNYYQLFREARELHKEGLISLDEETRHLVEETDIGEFALHEGNYVPLDCPMMVEEKEDPPLNKPKRGGSKKFYVYVRTPAGNIKKVSWGDTTGLSVKMNNPAARKSFAARHQCDQQTDRTSAAYWACNTPRYARQLGLSGGGSFYW